MLEVDVREKRGSVVIVLTGELDFSQELVCRQAFDSAPQELGRKLIIDLSGVTFMDSTGIKLLLQTDRSARSKSLRRPLIRGAAPQAMRVLNAAGVTAMLNIESPDEGFRSKASQWSVEHPSLWGNQVLAD